MRKLNRNMLNGPLFSNIVLYTIPIILTSVLQLLFNAADLIVVGRFCGSISVAAVGATGSLTALMVNFFIGFSVGTGVSVAHGMGAHEDEAIRRTVHTALPAALICGGVLTVVGVALSPWFLRLMGTPDTVISLSSVYMRIYFSGITFTMVYNFSAAILRAAGDTQSPLIYLTLAGVINVLLNLVFVTVFHMNVAGVALATAISQAISAVLVVRALMRRTDACKLVISQMKIYLPQLQKMIRIGLPAGIQSALFSISNVLIQSSINSFGDVLMSDNAASANIEGFVYVSLNAFHQTALNFIGQNAGAKQYRRVSKTLWICLALVAGVGITVGTAAWAAGPKLLSLYIADSPEAISWGMLRLAHISLPYFLCGLMDVATGALRGMGASILNMITSIVGVCGIRILWIATAFQAIGTFESLFLCYPLSWFGTFCMHFIMFLVVFHKEKKKLSQ